MDKTLQSIFLLIWGIVCLSFGWTFVGYFTIAVAVIIFLTSFSKKKQTNTDIKQPDSNTLVNADKERLSIDEAQLLIRKNIYKFREYSNYWKERDIIYYKEVYEPILEANRKKNRRTVIIILTLMTVIVIFIIVWVLSNLPPQRIK